MISIIGSGKVGSAISFLIGSKGLDDVLLLNRTKNKAVGEALDLSNTIPDDSSITITGTDDYSKIKDSELVVITASIAAYTTSRTDAIQEQVKMISDIRLKLEKHAPSAKILVVSNPLDVLTFAFQKQGNFSPDKVIGIASSLDTSRFRLLVAKELNVKQSDITDALVLGEHGDSMVPIFSRTKIKDTPVLECLDEQQVSKIIHDLRNYWKILREFKSRSVFGISRHVFDVIDAIINKKEISIPASVLLSGQYGESGICMGVPTIINKDGLVEINELELNQNESKSLHNSADTIRKYLSCC